VVNRHHNVSIFRNCLTHHYCAFYVFVTPNQNAISPSLCASLLVVSDLLPTISGAVANLELWEHSEVLFPFFSINSFSSPPLLSLLFPTSPSPPLSGDNNFNDFPENQLTIDFAFLYIFFASLLRERYCITVPPCPVIWGNGVPHKIFGGGTAFPLDYTTVYHIQHQSRS